MEGNKFLDKILEKLLKGDASKGLSITKVFENEFKFPSKFIIDRHF